jgi:hypothetical protein
MNNFVQFCVLIHTFTVYGKYVLHRINHANIYKPIH